MLTSNFIPCAAASSTGSLIKQMVAAGLGCDVTKRIVRRDGEVRHIRCVGAPVVEDGKLQRIVDTAMDVTEHELLNQELRRLEAYLAEAQRVSHTGSFGWKVSSGEIFWSDETFRIFQCNPSTNPTVEFVLSRVHPDDRNLVQQQIDQASRDGKGFDFEHRLQAPDGSIKHVRVTAHPSRDSLGNLEFVGAVTDISEQRWAEAVIRERESELRQILDLVPQHTFVLGADGSTVYANRAALEYFGVTINQWLDRGSRSELAHPDDLEYYRREKKKRLLEGVPHEFEMRFRRHDGKLRWFLLRRSPVKDEQGRITRWYSTATDIEDRKQAEEMLPQENVAFREEIDKASMLEEIVGTSRPLKAVLSGIAIVAPTDSTVLITGETGTGKELIARAIHKRSQRSGRAFVSVNCAAIPGDLIPSELFGHEKGAFTGAMQRRLGRFELADGGTIFLDEVGEFLPHTQVALLRVLQEREFERVGGGRTIHVDVRVIAATNRDLKAAVASGIFREDLFYRLNVFPIEVPPLRERKDDILMLVEYFMQRYANRAGKNVQSIDKTTLDLLQSYEWPGNIRELQNVIERSVILSSGEVFSVDESWFSKERSGLASGVEAQAPLKGEVEPRSEREIIEAALAESRGRVFGRSGAAAKLGIPPSTLDHRIKALKIHKKQFKFR